MLEIGAYRKKVSVTIQLAEVWAKTPRVRLLTELTASQAARR